VLDITVGGWAATVAVVVGLLTLDWLALGRRPHAIGLAEAIRWSAFYVAVALLFGCVFALLNGWGFGAQYFAGYAVEKSLSVDNLFVFVLIIAAFAVPAAHQPKVLSIGIAIALAMRTVFIAVGAELLALFSFMFLVFGIALLFTAVQLFRHRAEDPRVEDNVVVSLARRALPMTATYEDGRIVTRRDGRRLVTPLFLALLAIGTSDLLFAFDSIPAVFGVTDHAYIVFAANAFALLGLRPLFFLVSGLLDRLVYMSLGLAALLAFIGVKLVLQFAHGQDHTVPEISTGASLAVIVAVLVAVTIASMARARRDPRARAHAGALRGRPLEETAEQVDRGRAENDLERHADGGDDDSDHDDRHVLEQDPK
jgi:TerC family integral membrane protein